MAKVNKIDSNNTELRYAVEDSVGVLPVTPTWVQLDPNDYDDFGGKIKTVARNPINKSRQRKKGVVVDLDAAGGFTLDFTQDNVAPLMQGFLFAAARTKAELAATAVDGTGNAYTVPSGGGAYSAGDLLFAKSDTALNAANLGLKKVTSGGTGTSVPVTDTALVDETAAITISKVGREFTATEVSVDASGDLPKLVFATFDPTTLGLTVGEWLCVGDDQTAMKFTTAANNGLKRVRAIDATSITIDKSTAEMVTDAGTGKTIRIFFGRVVKNETGDLIKRYSYQFERSLGQPDDASSDTQYEYLTGGIADKLTLDVKQADKVTAKLNFMCRDHETRDAATGAKSGNRPTLKDADAFNSTSHIVRLALNIIDPTTPAPVDLFAFVTDLKLEIDNGVKANKAVKFLGAFDNTSSTLNVSANCTAYFQDVAAIQAVRNNDDATMDFTFAQHNKGVTFDMPLLSIGNALATVKQDEAIMVPIENAAATGAKIDVNLDHTLLVVFWDYLPDLAA